MERLTAIHDLANVQAEWNRRTRNLLAADWRSRLPRESVPFRSRWVFLVRNGNPEGIRDWDDLLRAQVRVAAPAYSRSGSDYTRASGRPPSLRSLLASSGWSA